MLRTLCFIPGEDMRADIPVKEFSTLLKNPEALLWVDFVGEKPEACESILTGIFRFHPLAVDDALTETHTPKIDDWNDYVYIVLNAMEVVNVDTFEIITKELDVFLGKNFVVTHHDEPIACIDTALAACQRDRRYTSHGPDHLLYKIIDDLVADYWPMVENLDTEIDALEDEIFAQPRPDLLQRIFTMKRTLVAMRRIIAPQREVLNKLARDDFEVVDERDRIFFRDIYDHLVRLHDLNESMRDLVGGVLDTYLSVVNNRMNDVMKTLTGITTLFMPISFVTGFFGMNFFEPSGSLANWTSRFVFGLILCVFVALPVIMYWWMRRRTWV